MKVNIREFFRNHSKIRRRIKGGERIILTSRGEPFALLIPLNDVAFKARTLLLQAGELLVESGISESEALALLRGRRKAINTSSSKGKRGFSEEE